MLLTRLEATDCAEFSRSTNIFLYRVIADMPGRNSSRYRGLRWNGSRGPCWKLLCNGSLFFDSGKPMSLPFLFFQLSISFFVDCLPNSQYTVLTFRWKWEIIEYAQKHRDLLRWDR